MSQLHASIAIVLDDGTISMELYCSDVEQENSDQINTHGKPLLGLMRQLHASDIIFRDGGTKTMQLLYD